MDEVDFLPHDIPDEILTCVTTLAILISITGILGNITTCIVILCSKSMHTITNLYLLSLSIADISILSIHGLETAYDIDLCSSIWCLIAQWILATAMNASALTITAFACERYLAICHPLMVHRISKKSRVKKIITVIWLTAALTTFISLVQLLNFSITGNTTEPLRDNMKPHIYFDAAMTGLCYIIPILVITIMYALIWMQLRKRLNKLQIATQTDQSASKQTLKMSIIIVAAFFLCWGPYHMTIIWLLFAWEYTDFKVVLSTLQLLYLMNTVSIGIYPTLNPFIYSIASRKFRKAFKDIISNVKRKWFSSTSNFTNNNTTNIPLEVIS